MVRTAAVARNALAAPPKRVHSPPVQEGLAQTPKRPKAVPQDGLIVLDKSAALWTQGLAKPRGGSRHLRLHDPFFEEPPYQQAYGLHQALTADQLNMVKDRAYLKVATMAIPTGFPRERNLR